MKIKTGITLFTATALLALAVGCKKEEPPKPVETPKTAAKDMQAIGTAVKDLAEKGVDKAKEGAAAVKAGAVKAVDAVKTEAKSLTASATDKAQEIISKAQSLVDAGKFQDALTALNNLKGMTLTDAQQKLVDGLKAQIQKALADKAAGGLFGK